MRNLTVEDFNALWPHAPKALVTGALASQVEAFEVSGISRALRLAHLMAQLSHESGGGTITEESLNYTHAERICQVWPSRFPTAASAQPFVKQPEKLAEKVYGGRMGNTAPGDGWKYRGRGLIQTTGKDGYARLGKLTGLNLVADPDLLKEPAHMFRAAVIEFGDYQGILSACDRDDLRQVTKLINGGYNGLAEREKWLAKWKARLGL